jgi:DNA-binding transcriptional regulator LsrR (DeoR family)
MVRAANDFEESVQSALGAAAAHYLETTLKPREAIGADSWNATLRSMVEQMHLVWKVAECQVVQVLGGVGDPSAEKHAHYLMTQLASLVQGEAHFLPAPFVVHSKDAADALAQDPHLRETMVLFDGLPWRWSGLTRWGPRRCSPPAESFFRPKNFKPSKRKGRLETFAFVFTTSAERR